MAEEKKEFKLPTRLQFQRLLMAHRVLTARGLEPTKRLYQLILNIHGTKDELGLEFREEFRVRVPSEAILQGQEGKLKQDLMDELKPKIDKVHQAVVARIKEINTALVPPEELKRLSTDADKDKARKKAIETKLEKSDLERNIGLLSDALHFDEIQREILLFFACAPKGRFDRILEAAHLDEVVSHEDYIESLAILLDLRDKKEALKAELDPDSILVGVKFLAHDEKQSQFSVDKPLQRILAGNYKSVDDLLFALLGPSPTTELTIADYTYMADDVDDMAATLEGYYRNRGAKIRHNMTLGGPPGTGKTELTAILAQRLKARVFLVGVAEKSKATGFSLEEPTRNDRINALVRCAFIVRQTKMNAILVFDEAEDILRDLNRAATKEQGSKEFTNELLEGLGTRVIFISNRTDLFDPATTRRTMPYYGMNYMPLAARIGTIITKTKKYIGADLTQDDVKKLSRMARELSVAIIDTCVRTASLRILEDISKSFVLKEIDREFSRALKAQNGGVPSLPITIDFEPERFDPNLISAPDGAIALIADLTAKAGNLAGADITLIGPVGTGRKSVAQYIAATRGLEARVVPIWSDWLEKDPDNAHALDLERATLDKIPLVFTGALQFLANSNGHPFMNRVRAHTLPTFFVSDVPHNATQKELEGALSHLTFVIRTNCLSDAQMQSACKRMLGVDVATSELKTVGNMGIGSVVIVQRQLQTLGLEGNRDAALEKLGEISCRLKEQKGPVGFGEVAAFTQRDMQPSRPLRQLPILSQRAGVKSTTSHL